MPGAPVSRHSASARSQRRRSVSLIRPSGQTRAPSTIRQSGLPSDDPTALRDGPAFFASTPKLAPRAERRAAQFARCDSRPLRRAQAQTAANAPAPHKVHSAAKTHRIHTHSIQLSPSHRANPTCCNSRSLRCAQTQIIANMPMRTARSAPSKGTEPAPTASNPRLSPSTTSQRDLHSLCREQPACCNSRSLRHATSPLQTPGAAVCMKPPRPHSKIHSPRANHSSSLHALSALKPFGICPIPINMQFFGTKSSLELQISPLFALFREFQNPRLGCAVSARRAYPSPCSLPRGRPPARRHCAPAPAARWFQ